LNRWVVKFGPLMAAQAQSRKKPTAKSWRIDETYIKVKGKWTYYYWAVDNTGKTLDFMLSERRDKAACSATTTLAGSDNHLVRWI
jgi:putative transposase